MVILKRKAVWIMNGNEEKLNFILSQREPAHAKAFCFKDDYFVS